LLKYIGKKFATGGKSIEIIESPRLTANVSSPSGSFESVMGTPKAASELDEHYPKARLC